jgi:hypothetical protein
MMPYLIGESEDREIKVMYSDGMVWLESWNGKELCKPVPCRIECEKNEYADAILKTIKNPDIGFDGFLRVGEEELI